MEIWKIEDKIMLQIKNLLGEYFMKLKHVLGVLLAGLVIAAAAWKSHVAAELGKEEQVKKEEAAKQEAAAKLAAETAKLEAEKKEKEAKLEAEKKEKEAKLETEIKEKAEKLKKGDAKEVKKEAAAALGLKEKKKKGIRR